MREITIEDKKMIIATCNQRDIKNVYVESHFADGRDISQIRITFYSGSDQGILYDIDKDEANELLYKIYAIKNDILMDKYKELLT